MNLAVPIALRECCAEDVELRNGLPLQIFSQAGFCNSLLQNSTQEYIDLIKTTQRLLLKVTENIGIALHEAVDIMSVDFMESRLPPSSSHLDRILGKYKDKINEYGCFGPLPNDPDFMVRLVDTSFIRLVIDDGLSHDGEDADDELSDDEFDHIEDHDDNESDDDDNDDSVPLLHNEDDNEEDSESDDEINYDEPKPTALVFYSTRNEISTHMGPNTQPNCLRFSLDLVTAISYLIQQYPNFVKISNIPRIENQEITSILGMLVALWSCGILITEKSKKRTRSPDKKQKHPNKRRKLNK